MVSIKISVPQDGENTSDKLGERLEETIGDDLHVRNRSADQIASRLSVNVAQRHVLQMGEKITAQVPDGVCRQTVGTPGT